MRSIELFSGAGGLAKGLEKSGVLHQAFVEWNKDACNTLRGNFNPDIVHQADIADFDFSIFNSIDIVAGGPPCQPFSLGGKHQAHNDSRDMFPMAIRAIEELVPKTFIFENVKGLLRSSFSMYFEYIIKRLTIPSLHQKIEESWSEHLIRLRKAYIKQENHEYNVSYKLVNAADFGVPQKRERIIIVGIRSDIPAVWSFPTETHSEDALNWSKYVDGSYWTEHGLDKVTNTSMRDNLINKYGLFPPTEKRWNTVRDCLTSIPHPCERHDINDHIFKDGARSYPGHTGSDLDEPSKTLKAGGHGVPGGENMIRYADGSVRYFTVHEAKLLQTFPPDYIISGAWGEAMRQIGNAVPVKLGNILGDQLNIILTSRCT